MKPTKPKTLEFEVDTAVYPLEAVQNACYRFIDRAFLRVAAEKEGKTKVSIKPRGSDDGFDAIEDEFHNELLHQALRLRVSESNQRIREFIVTKALVSAQPGAVVAAEADCPECRQGAAPQPPQPGKEAAPAPADPELEAEIEKLLAEIEKGGEGDPLKVAVPWEEKHGEGKDKDKPR